MAPVSGTYVMDHEVVGLVAGRRQWTDASGSMDGLK